MNTPLELAVRERLVDYLTDETTLDEFKDWLVGATWDVDDLGDPGMMDLVYSIKLLLAEHSSGHRSDEDLRAELLPLVDRYQTTVILMGADSETVVQTRSAVTAFPGEAKFLGTLVGTLFEAGSGSPVSRPAAR